MKDNAYAALAGANTNIEAYCALHQEPLAAIGFDVGNPFRGSHGQHHLATYAAPFGGTSARSIGVGSSGLPLP